MLADVYIENTNQQDPSINTINPQTFALDEQDNTPLPSPANEIAPAITGVTNVNTPLPQNKNNMLFEEHKQFINMLEVQMSVLKSIIR